MGYGVCLFDGSNATCPGAKRVEAMMQVLYDGIQFLLCQYLNRELPQRWLVDMTKLMSPKGSPQTPTNFRCWNYSIFAVWVPQGIYIQWLDELFHWVHSMSIACIVVSVCVCVCVCVCGRHPLVRLIYGAKMKPACPVLGISVLICGCVLC